MAKRGGTMQVETLNIAEGASPSPVARHPGDIGMTGFVHMPGTSAPGTERSSGAWTAVPILQDLPRLRNREAIAAALGAHLPLRGLRLRVRPGRERRPQHPDVPEGRLGLRRRGDPQDGLTDGPAKSTKRQQTSSPLPIDAGS